MAEHTHANPYRAPVDVAESLKTHRGLGVPGCSMRFALIGALAGITSGVVMATLDLLGFNATAIMLTPGLMFGIGLSFAIHRYIGDFAVTRRFTLIPGCLAGFGIIGVVIEFTIFRFTYPHLEQPVIRCACYLTASATGFLLIATLLSWVIDVFRWKSHLSLWFIGTSVGFVAISSVLELIRITGQASLAMLIANAACQVITLGAIGWQLAVAQVSQNSAQQT